MRMRPAIGRPARLLAAGILLAATLPSAAVAANADPNFCNEAMAVTFTAPAPAGLLALGTHRVEFRATYTDAATGELVVDEFSDNAVTVSTSAPAYPNTVLVRLFRSTTLLADGSVAVVDTILPTQATRLYVNVSWLRDEKFFAGEFLIAYRYETRKNHWTDYAPLSASSTKAFCVEQNSALWQKKYGWE